MSALRSGTVRRRFTILNAVVILGAGLGLLALTFAFSGISVTRPVPGAADTAPDSLAAAQQRADDLAAQLADVHTNQTHQLLAGALIAVFVMAVVSVLLGQALATRALRPLRLITSATRRISADSLDRRLAVPGPADEVKDLADTIDELLERLETSFTAQRRFVANASHELRTPLTTMRASLDVAIAKPAAAASTVALADRLRPQLDRVDHLLDGLLVLARAQHGALADMVAVDLGELIDGALADRADEIAAKNLVTAVDVLPGTAVQGSPALLGRLVANVVDNAVTHNEPGGWLTITAIANGDRATFVIETGGPVLDQRQVDRLAQPFERLGSERVGSSGLGLSIVAAVAVAHGGRLTLSARPTGGLRVAVALRAAA